MNLVNGRVLTAPACDGVLDTLEQRVQETMAKGGLRPERVIAACGRLLDELDETVYLQVMDSLGIHETQGRGYLAEARTLFGADALRARVQKELGPDYPNPATYTPPGRTRPVTETVLPLGVLLHIAAGNADGLPAFSVLEGLLTGNINILKLPAADGGLSVRLLLEFLQYIPEAAEYIYVFDYSSRDIDRINTLIDVADAVVVWGGDEAVRALRGAVPPNIRVIEWGHKLGFAYVTERGITDGALSKLATHIIETKQLLCSSCQGVFLDTEDDDAVQRFCVRFLPFLEAAARGEHVDIGVLSQSTLRLYTEELEGLYSPRTVYKGAGNRCSITAYPDRVLELSHQFGHMWVRSLPRGEIVKVLRPHKNHLQTAGLICAEEERTELAAALLKTGVVRVCAPENMSAPYAGAPHDGEFPLRRYTKTAVLE